MERSRFELFGKYCSPIFATFAFPPEPVEGFQRIICTQSLPQFIIDKEVDAEIEARKAKEAKAKAKKSKRGKRRQKAPLEYDRRRRDACFQHRTTILAGAFEASAIQTALRDGIVTVELHDRDIIGSHQSMLEIVRSALEKQRAEASAEADSAQAEDISSNVLKRFHLAWESTCEAARRSGDTNTHGIAQFKFEPILSLSLIHI